jgi:hypothetical protein
MCCRGFFVLDLCVEDHRFLLPPLLEPLIRQIVLLTGCRGMKALREEKHGKINSLPAIRKRADEQWGHYDKKKKGRSALRKKEGLMRGTLEDSIGIRRDTNKTMAKRQ